MPTTRFYDVIDDNISINFSTQGERDRCATLTIEEVEQLIIELKDRLITAKEARIKIKEARIKILEEEINVLKDKQTRVKADLDYRTDSLKNLREELGKVDT